MVHFTNETQSDSQASLQLQYKWKKKLININKALRATWHYGRTPHSRLPFDEAPLI